MLVHRAVLLPQSVSLFPDIPILELTPPHPARNNSHHFKCLREPILQPLCFQIYAGMGGCTPLLLDTPVELWRSGTCLKSFTCNIYGPPRKCGKQLTYGMPKPFRCNTYKNTGEGLWLATDLSVSTFRPSDGQTFRRLPSSPPVLNRTDDSALPRLYCRCAILPSLRSGDRPFLPPWRPS
jgi:hypothetical protein